MSDTDLARPPSDGNGSDGVQRLIPLSTSERVTVRIGADRGTVTFGEGALMPSCHVFVATSLDGFIARHDGAIDWLLAHDAGGEDHGYERFVAGIDAIVMGRGSYEKVREFEPWPYERPVLVLSATLAGAPVPERLEGKVRVMDLSPEDALSMLHAEGCQRVYVDGGKLIQSFLRRGLIEDMVITFVPVLLGSGRPLFGTLEADLSLAHEATVSFPSGLVQIRYRLLR
jgi:dihydrofolate reductase